MNCLNPIEKLYDIYLEEENTPKIAELGDDGLGLDSDIEDGPADLFLEL